MSILNSIKDKAKLLVGAAEPYVVRQTKTYDPSKNSIIVAGMPLDGVVSVNITSDVLTRQETGIDYYYTAIVENIEQRTMSVSVLPTAHCLGAIRMLTFRQQENRGWFNIAIYENDLIVNVYRGWVLSLPEIDMQREASDRVITFGIKPMHTGTSLIDQPTPFEDVNYSQYGANPSAAGAQDNSIIDENSGIITTPLGSVPVVQQTIENT